MNCERVRSLLPAYVDGELDLITSLEIEEHLAACPECSRVYAKLRELQSVLASQRAALREPAPPALAQRVRAALRQAQSGDNPQPLVGATRGIAPQPADPKTQSASLSPSENEPRPVPPSPWLRGMSHAPRHPAWSWATHRKALVPQREAPVLADREPQPTPTSTAARAMQRIAPTLSTALRRLAPTFAAAAFLLLLIILALGLANGWPFAPRTELLAQEVETAHVRALITNHLTDVTSTDQHTVKPWFDGKLDFSPPVVDLAAQGFPLTGGRLDYVDNHQAAALVYMRNKHVINLLIWPTPDPSTGPRQTTINGYHLVSWNQSGMTFYAVSDVEISELLEFVGLIEKNAS